MEQEVFVLVAVGDGQFEEFHSLREEVLQIKQITLLGLAIGARSYGYLTLIVIEQGDILLYLGKDADMLILYS